MDNKIQVNTVKPDVSFFENDVLNRLINLDREVYLDSKVESVENYMNLNPGQGLSDTDKDIIYGSAQELYKDYKNSLVDVKFNFYLNRPQYNLLTDLILKKLEYDVNTVFIAIELTQLMGGMNGTKYSNDEELRCFEVTATELTYVYHLIQSHKVKGLTKEAYVFSGLLVRIGNISKLINYYDAYAKNLPTQIQEWALKMDASDTLVGEVIPIQDDAYAKNLPTQIQEWALKMDASDTLVGEVIPIQDDANVEN